MNFIEINYLKWKTVYILVRMAGKSLPTEYKNINKLKL